MCIQEPLFPGLNMVRIPSDSYSLRPHPFHVFLSSWVPRDETNYAWLAVIHCIRLCECVGSVSSFHHYEGLQQADVRHRVLYY